MADALAMRPRGVIYDVERRGRPNQGPAPAGASRLVHDEGRVSRFICHTLGEAGHLAVWSHV